METIHSHADLFFQPPTVLRPSEGHSEQESVEIAVTKLLLRSYYDIVRKNIEDSVPKAIMHFLVISVSCLISIILLYAVNERLILFPYDRQWCI